MSTLFSCRRCGRPAQGDFYVVTMRSATGTPEFLQTYDLCGKCLKAVRKTLVDWPSADEPDDG
jgi:hypothetical protein